MSRREGICILESLSSLFAWFLVLRFNLEFTKESHNTFLLFVRWYFLVVEVSKHLFLLYFSRSVTSTSLESLLVLTLCYNCHLSLCLPPLLVVEVIYSCFLQLLSLRNQSGLVNFDIVADIFRYWLDLRTKPKSSRSSFIFAHRCGLVVVVLSWVFGDTLRTSGIAMIVLKPIPQFYSIQILRFRNTLGVMNLTEVSQVGWITSVQAWSYVWPIILVNFLNQDVAIIQNKVVGNDGLILI